MPGRLWDGKEAVLNALAALCKSCHAALGSDGGSRVVSALLEATGVHQKLKSRNSRVRATFCT